MKEIFRPGEVSRSDADLVGECLTGDETAWSALIDKYKNLIFSIPVKYGFPADQADEVFQEVCLALLQELPRLRQPRALAAWLIQTTSHRCFHQKRESRRYVATGTENNAPILESREMPDDLLHEVEQEQAVREAVAELP